MIKHLPLRIIIFPALFFLLLTTQLKAQDSSPEGPLPVHLAWAEDTSALRYEVIIEKEEGGTFLERVREFTDTFSIQTTLPPGKYRCQVIPYDYLEKPGKGSDWLSFEVRVPVKSAPPVEQSKDTGTEPAVPPEEEPASPIEYTIARQDLIIQPEVPKLFHFYLSAAWMPLLPIYGKGNQFLGQDPSLSGAGLRFGMLYTTPSSLDIGLELAGSWYVPSAATNAASNENLTRNAGTAALNLVLQKRFLEDALALRFRLGGGLSLLADGQSIHAIFGLSFAWFPLKHLFLETGLDYFHLFTETPSGCLRPWIGMGLQF